MVRLGVNLIGKEKSKMKVFGGSFLLGKRIEILAGLTCYFSSGSQPGVYNAEVGLEGGVLEVGVVLPQLAGVELPLVHH